tara:strand:+ start:544 stop:909 length:366 start_codon:yes stop_codon:yes gene_type:complete
MKNVIKGISILAFTILSSCSGTINKSWYISEFSSKQKFSIEVPKNKNVSNANIYLNGSFDGEIYIGRNQNDTIFHFSKKNFPTESILIDFYGGTFDLVLLPSNAKGHLNIRVEIPYHKSIF